MLELDTDEDGKAIRAEMADFVGRTSVPAIWIGGEFVGGCNDVSDHIQNQYVRNDSCLFLPFSKHNCQLLWHFPGTLRAPWVALIPSMNQISWMVCLRPWDHCNLIFDSRVL